MSHAAREIEVRPAAGVAKRAWHAESVQATLAELHSAPTGLTAAEAGRRLRQFGPNLLPAPRRRSRLLRFVLQFHNVLIYVLLGAAVLSALLQHPADAFVILAVVVVNAVVGYLQEGKAERAMDAIRHMLAPTGAVIRDNRRVSVPADTLVVGDVALLEPGDKVPADLRLIESRGLRVDEAILTGESVPVDKDVSAVDAASALADRRSMAYSGTLINAGQARGVVVATGSATEVGRITGMLADVEELTTPLLEQMSRFARRLTLVILACAALLLLVGHYLLEHPFAEIFMVMVGLSVAAIPEGLPAVLTITLAVAVRAMGQRNAIVRRLPAIETVGAVSVICTDKTGTLTLNEMAVVTAVTATDSFTVDGIGYAPYGTLRAVQPGASAGSAIGLDRLARAAALCNDASLREHANNWSVVGDPMEGALLAFASKVDPAWHAGGHAWTRTDAIPFDAHHRYMATLDHDHDGHACIFVKGAPERVLDMCRAEIGAGGEPEALRLAHWRAVAEDIARRGQRVIALAERPVPFTQTVLGHADVADSLILLGVVGLIDPPRPEVIDAIAECHGAGIQVKMITGDHAATALAIGRNIGLRRTEQVLTGTDLDNLNDAALAASVESVDVYARTSPAHKLRLVEALQRRGHIVAMTGDGVNDAPALKRADAGIAMGRKGSEAAKEASVLVLADDNFATIVAAIREGRTAYDNLKKVISWTLPTSTGEAVTVVVALLLGLALPVTPVQILWVNLVTAVTLGIALAFEPTEPGTMRRPPRHRAEPLLDAGLVWHIVLVSGLFLAGAFGIYFYSIARGDSLDLTRTLAVNALVAMEIFHLFFIRNIYGTSLTLRAVAGTPVVWACIATIVIAQIAFTFAPPFQTVFGSAPVSVRDGLLVIGIGVALFVVVEIEKQIRLHWRGAGTR